MGNIVVVDLGTGNLHSVVKAVEFVTPNRKVVVSHQPEVISKAERIILPGQGAIGTWMEQLVQEHIKAALRHALQTKPVLGICLGLQALFESSSEYAEETCLDVLPGNVKHFAESFTDKHADLSIPHMGWNNVYQTSSHPLWQGIDDGARFYFVHSYFAQCALPEQQVGRCDYGLGFTAAAAKDKLFAVQFHPEKSQHDGLQLIKNFVHWQP